MLVMFLAIYLPVIRYEEDFLRQKFPRFDDYAQNVPACCPAGRPIGNTAGLVLAALVLATSRVQCDIGHCGAHGSLGGQADVGASDRKLLDYPAPEFAAPLIGTTLPIRVAHRDWPCPAQPC